MINNATNEYKYMCQHYKLHDIALIKRVFNSNTTVHSFNHEYSWNMSQIWLRWKKNLPDSDFAKICCNIDLRWHRNFRFTVTAHVYLNYKCLIVEVWSLRPNRDKCSHICYELPLISRSLPIFTSHQHFLYEAWDIRWPWP